MLNFDQAKAILTDQFNTFDDDTNKTAQSSAWYEGFIAGCCNILDLTDEQENELYSIISD